MEKVKRRMENISNQINLKSHSAPPSEIIKFKDFMINELRGEEDIIAYLYALKNEDVNGYINTLLTLNSRENDLKKDYIEDILLEVGDKIDPSDFRWVSKELKKYIKHDKKH